MGELKESEVMQYQRNRSDLKPQGDPDEGDEDPAAAPQGPIDTTQTAAYVHNLYSEIEKEFEVKKKYCKLDKVTEFCSGA